MNAPILAYSLATAPFHIQLPEFRSILGVPASRDLLFQDVEVDKLTVRSLFDRSSPTSRPIQTSILLLRSHIDSHYGYDRWASLQTGFGQIFADDEKRLTKLRGGGMQEPGRLYLGLKFRF